MSVPVDYNIAVKQIEMVSNYSDLKVEIARVWKTLENNVMAISGVTGALCCIQLKFKESQPTLYKIRFVNATKFCLKISIFWKVLLVWSPCNMTGSKFFCTQAIYTITAPWYIQKMMIIMTGTEDISNNMIGSIRKLIGK